MAFEIRPLLVSLLLLASHSHAAVFAAGTLSPTPYSAVVTPGVGDFADKFDFTIGTDTAFELGAAALTLPSPLGGADLYHIIAPTLTIQLFDASNIAVGSASFNATFNDFVLSQTLQAGDYSILVRGHADGQAGGIYAMALAAVSAVPEPRAWWLMLAGIAAVVPVVRRKVHPS